MKFSELGLNESIVRAVAAKGYDTPTPIQALSIPEALNGRDVLGCAQTGTGKTCAFALPILHRLAEQGNGKGSNRRAGYGRPPRALVLCPTRELAMQIYESFVGYGKHLQLRHAVVFGGVNQRSQVRALRDGVDVLVATPGRLHDLIDQGHIDLSRVEVLVLDEADRMLDMGFIHDIRKVVEIIPDERQTLFFSATVSKDIRRLADRILNDPASVETAPESTTVELIAQKIYMVEKANKPELLERILGGREVERALVFTRTKYGADKLVKALRRDHVNAEAIHGDKSQNARTRTMKRFKSGGTRILIATDIASRGIDVDEITHVINYDMPIDSETYVHRIGRTARAGASGIAISFCDHDEMGKYRSVERRTKIKIEVGLDHDDLTFEAPAGRGGGGAKHGGSRKRFGGGSGGGRSRRPAGNGRSSASNERPTRSERTERPARGERAEYGERQNTRSGGKKKGKANQSSEGSFPYAEPKPKAKKPKVKGKGKPNPVGKKKVKVKKGNGYPRTPAGAPGTGVRQKKATERKAAGGW